MHIETYSITGIFDYINNLGFVPYLLLMFVVSNTMKGRCGPYIVEAEITDESSKEPSSLMIFLKKFGTHALMIWRNMGIRFLEGVDSISELPSFDQSPVVYPTSSDIEKHRKQNI